MNSEVRNSCGSIADQLLYISPKHTLSPAAHAHPATRAHEGRNEITVQHLIELTIRFLCFHRTNEVP